MDDKERLANLKCPCVDVDFLRETHGIDWPPDEQFERDFGAWLDSLRGTTPCEDGKAHRYAFEKFLQSQRLLTRKYAAARLGMQPESLDQVLPQLPRIGLSKKYAVYRGISDESVSEDLVRTLPGLRFRTFGNHDSFCKALHEELLHALELEIRPLFCATAKELGEHMYASTWDNITLLPLSVKHSLWLDFKKPIALSPDRCSKLFFARHQDELRPYLAGHEDPRDMRYYIDFTRRSA